MVCPIERVIIRSQLKSPTKPGEKFSQNANLLKCSSKELADLRTLIGANAKTEQESLASPPYLQ